MDNRFYRNTVSMDVDDWNGFSGQNRVHKTQTKSLKPPINSTLGTESKKKNASYKTNSSPRTAYNI